MFEPSLGCGRITGALCLIAAIQVITGCAETSADASGESAEAPDHEALAITDPAFANFVAKLTGAERAQFSEFLKNAGCVQTNCYVDDVAFASRAEIAAYFQLRLDRQAKGLVVSASKTWSTLPITVCWTTSTDPSLVDDATLADKANVIAAIEATWAKYSLVSFDWYSSGTTPRTCNAATAPNYNIRLSQSTMQTRGCSALGKNNQSGIGCSGSIAHPYANMIIKAGMPSRDSIIAVHEFGHMIGFYHEQDRTDSLCTSETNPEQSGSRHVGDYDRYSIMNYCAGRQLPNISSGDAVAVALLYGGRSISPTFSIRSWMPTDVTYTATSPSGSTKNVTQTGVSLTASSGAFGAAKTGDVLKITPTSTSLRCSLKGTRPSIEDRVEDVLAIETNPVPAECYSVALIDSAI